MDVCAFSIARREGKNTRPTDVSVNCLAPLANRYPRGCPIVGARFVRCSILEPVSFSVPFLLPRQGYLGWYHSTVRSWTIRSATLTVMYEVDPLAKTKVPGFFDYWIEERKVVAGAVDWH